MIKCDECSHFKTTRTYKERGTVVFYQGCDLYTYALSQTCRFKPVEKMEHSRAIKILKRIRKEGCLMAGGSTGEEELALEYAIEYLMKKEEV